MKAIKQILRVKNNKVSITLPDNFEDEEVEGNVFSKEDGFILTDEQKTILDERLKEPNENYISAEESIGRLKRKYGV